MSKTKSKKEKPSAGKRFDSSSAENLLGREFSTAVIAFHEAISSRLGMSATEWKSLGVLDQHGPLTAGRLAELSGFTTGAITGIVDRLERAGYVRRERHATDRRSIIIHPLRLREMKARIAPVFASLGRAMGEVSSHYSPQELAAIQNYMTRTIQVLRKETADLRSRAQVRALHISGPSRTTATPKEA